MKFLVTAFAALVLMLTASAQITVTQGSIAGIGSSYTSYMPTSLDGVANPGPAGANQSWSIPEAEVAINSVVTVESPSGTPYTADFPTATHAYTSTVNGSAVGWSFLRVESNALYNLGFAGTGGIAVVTVYDPAGIAAPLPLTYGTSGWTTVTRWVYTPGAGIVITQTDSTINEVDGWGTMTTQFGASSVLRQKQHHFSINVSETPFTPPNTIETSYWAYSWVTTDGTPVVTMTSSPDEPNPNFTQGTISFSIFGTETAEPSRGPVADNFAVGQNYPNPFNPTTSLPITLAQAGTVDITIYNELGEVVSSETRTFGPGSHTVGFDGSAWASGNYFAQVKAGDQLQTKRMTLVK